MHYVVGDVHGCYNELTTLLDIIEEQDENAEIIFVGDFIDRGKDVWKVLEWAMSHITADGKYQCVRGNHEDLVIQWYKEWMVWWNKGGFDSGKLMPETHFDFSLWVDAMDYCTPQQLDPIITFFQNMPTKKEVTVCTEDEQLVEFSIVHAWDNFDTKEDEKVQENVHLWSRDCLGNYENDKIIIHGHTPTISSGYFESSANAPGMIGYQHNSINVDGGCCFARVYSQYPCMLCAICLETLEEFYASTVEERFQELLGEVSDEDELKEHIDSYKKKYLGRINKFRKEMLKTMK